MKRREEDEDPIQVQACLTCLDHQTEEQLCDEFPRFVGARHLAVSRIAAYVLEEGKAPRTQLHCRRQQ